MSQVGKGSAAVAAAAFGAAGVAAPAGAEQHRVSVLARGAIEAGALGPLEHWKTNRVERFVPPIPDDAVAAVKAAFGKRYAGVYYWRTPGKDPVLVLRLTKVRASDRAFVEAALRRPEFRLMTSDVVIAPARLSEDQLLAARDRLVRTLARGASVGINQSTNSVVVSKTKAHTLAYPTGAAGNYGGTAILIGDARSPAYHACTAGFAVTRVPFTGRFMVTAGHCSDDTLQNVLGGEQGFPVGTGWGALIGQVSLRHLAGNGDVTFYSAAGAMGRQWTGSTTYYVQGAENPRVNEWVCFNGAKSGAHCGTVSIVNTTIKAIDGTKTYNFGNQFCVNSAGAQGDSGAGIWAPSTTVTTDKKVRIRGVLSSGSGNRTCATQVGNFQSAFGASVVTEANPCA